MILRFPLRAPPGLKLTISTITSNKWVKRTYRQHVAFRPLGVYRHLFLCLALANDLQLTKVIKDNLEGQSIMQLRHQSTPTNLMHKHTWHKVVIKTKVRIIGGMHRGLPSVNSGLIYLTDVGSVSSSGSSQPWFRIRKRNKNEKMQIWSIQIHKVYTTLIWLIHLLFCLNFIL
jgi:hypothetical protein